MHDIVLFERLQENKERGLIIVVSAPSGTGKTTLCRKLVETVPKASFSVSVTSRSPRVGETSGRDYIFLSEKEFIAQADAGGFIEWARVHDHYYGTSREFVEQSLREGTYVILDIDVQGGLQIKKQYPETLLIFVMPPSMDELRARLVKRRQDTDAEIEKRIRNSYDEMRRALEYDYLVENRDLEKALNEMKCIISAEKCRVR